MSNWYDRAYEELEKSLENGEIDEEQFCQELRYLRDELEQSRQDASDEAYYNY